MVADCKINIKNVKESRTYTISQISCQIFLHPVDKADILNKYFFNISKIDVEPELPNNVPDPPNSMEEFVITENEVLDQFSN